MRRGTRTLSAIFAVSGVLHLVAPRIYESIVPNWLPRQRALVYGSGLAELACAAGLATERAWAGPASAAVLIGVLPANIQMAVDASRAGKPWWHQVAAWGRVPMQLPLIRMALTPRRA